MRQRFDLFAAARWACVSALILSCVAATTPAAQRAPTTSAPMTLESQQALVNQYCVGCHSDKLKTGGLSLENELLAAAREICFGVLTAECQLLNVPQMHLARVGCNGMDLCKCEREHRQHRDWQARCIRTRRQC